MCNNIECVQSGSTVINDVRANQALFCHLSSHFLILISDSATGDRIGSLKVAFIPHVWVSYKLSVYDYNVLHIQCLQVSCP